MKISARKDLTPTERKEEEALFKEMKEKHEQSRAAGDDIAKWVRKNSKVVNVGKYPPQHPSSSEDNQNLNQLLRTVTEAKPQHLLVLGDFNFLEIDWEKKLRIKQSKHKPPCQQVSHDWEKELRIKQSKHKPPC
ncbi:hypothetical protein HAZT_HAZT001149 [Hyalella azteca]|uniref:Endonuclease/exonuclease/phosphatase domain-containing protein n=1 Tax=Hyalella azteca TaxID=294128 RepID=A0A6A0H195_HYAAZ|nr:hypothetical protein HAZT_HAZT001149 [Hyalella azteca]